MSSRERISYAKGASWEIDRYESGDGVGPPRLRR
jgi:hypothetical protein